MNGVTRPGSAPRRAAVDAVLRVARSVPAGGPTRGVAVLPTSTAGSLGDEAMARSIAALMAGRGRQASILSYDGRPVGDVGVGTSPISLKTALPGRSEALGLARLSRRLRHFDALVFAAGDVLDGAYSPRLTHRRIEIVRLAANLGLATAIVGFSFRRDPAPWAVALMRTVPAATVLTAREDVSQENVSAAVGREVGVGADLAFLLEPAPEDDPLIVDDLRWIASARESGRMVVGFSPNCLVDHLGIGAKDSSVRQYGAAVDALLAQTDAAVLLLPHDHRGDPSDFAIAGGIAAGKDPARVRLMGAACGAPHVKRLSSRIDVIITSRMHAGIAALGSGVPARIADYQGKIEGLAKLTQLSELSFPPSAFEDPAAFAALVASLTPGRLEAERRTLAAVLPEIRRRSARNGDAVGSRVG